MDKRKVAVYCRVGSNDDGVWIYSRVAREDGNNLQEQEMSLIDFSRKKGYNIVGITKESGNGNDNERQGLKTVLENAAKHKFNRLIIKDVSRLARDTIMANRLINQLQALGVRIETLVEGDFDYTLHSAISDAIGQYKPSNRKQGVTNYG